MSFACLDDHWDEHPKYVELELEHFGLMACAIVYCNRNLTDGFVPEKAVRGFGKSGRGAALAKRLVTDGRWTKCAGGYWVVGYLDHNLSREEVVARRTERAAAGRRGGQARAQAVASSSRQAKAQAVANTNVLPSPFPTSPLPASPYQAKRSAAAKLSQDHKARAKKPKATSRQPTTPRVRAPTLEPLPEQQQDLKNGLSEEETEQLRAAEARARQRLDLTAKSGLQPLRFEMPKAGGES